ncbi:UDP-xylose and UDP-N-acetylglucosamine transporter [Geodia barretti]|uniref:UDP-xylose and UDP-N-acetylglucosamine transporter n=1 Tax=Geodia barretti TaxID=519541 RepID=A0AA35SWV1_GEOBA|nr:UDP-xylose and UDP-N-acetylglucosamine transporter [Geodia barretti]
MGANTVPLAIFLVFLGCASNVVILEMIVKEDSGAGNIVTFCQFLFISVEGLFFVSHFFTVPPIIPIRKYMIMVILYFCVSVINNYSLIFDIPMPLHMIFRAGSLMANMILGILPTEQKISSVQVSVSGHDNCGDLHCHPCLCWTNARAR